MKKIRFLTFLCLIPLITGCNQKQPINNDDDKPKPLSTFVYSDYKNVGVVTDLDSYFNDTVGSRQFLADDNGIIISQYHSLKINDIDVPVYSTRVGCGIHSFCYILVNEDYVNLDVDITTFKSFNKTVVLPLSAGVTATTNKKHVTAKLNDFGIFSFAFNDVATWGLTIMVAKYEAFSCPQGYEVVEFEPGDYSGGANSSGLHLNKECGSFALNEENKAYYFKKGHYLIHDINFGSNVEVYFEPGTYLEAYCYYEENGTTKDSKAFMHSHNTSHVKVYGNALCDFAAYVGGGPNNPLRSAFGFSTVNNYEFKGMIGIDNSGWTLCFTNSTNLDISWNMLLSYKECSDGIMLSDCQDSRIHHNFCRVGDDAIEAKSTGSLGSKNLVYDFNAVWADKCRCYGCIYEANKDMENIIFRNNSVGFSLPNWTNLGCLVVALGNHKETVWHDIHFEDTEIYYAKTQILSMYSTANNDREGGSIKNIYFKNITCYGPFLDHAQLVYINICENSTMGRCYIENFMYKNMNGEMTKYVQEDTKNNQLTYVKAQENYSLKNIVVS